MKDNCTYRPLLKYTTSGTPSPHFSTSWLYASGSRLANVDVPMELREEGILGVIMVRILTANSAHNALNHIDIFIQPSSPLSLLIITLFWNHYSFYMNVWFFYWMKKRKMTIFYHLQYWFWRKPTLADETNFITKYFQRFMSPSSVVNSQIVKDMQWVERSTFIEEVKDGSMNSTEM